MDDVWSINNGLIPFIKEVYLFPASSLIDTIVATVHNGTQKTLQLIQNDFYRKGMKVTIQELWSVAQFVNNTKHLTFIQRVSYSP